MAPRPDQEDDVVSKGRCRHCGHDGEGEPCVNLRSSCAVDCQGGKDSPLTEGARHGTLRLTKSLHVAPVLKLLHRQRAQLF
jgi:hypothetical protein